MPRALTFSNFHGETCGEKIKEIQFTAIFDGFGSCCEQDFKKFVLNCVLISIIELTVKI